MIIDGKLISKQIRHELKLEVDILKTKGIIPKLVVVLVGEDYGSQKYVKNKEKGCEQVGIASETYRMSAETSEKELIDLLKKLNNDVTVTGILVQMPLPKHIDEHKIITLINPQKDVDGFHPINVGKLSIGDEALTSCTPSGVMELLERYNIELEGRNSVVIGRSNIVGKPMAMMLTAKNATVTVCHSRTKDLASELRKADIVVSAIGKAKMIKADMIKEGAVLIDVGITRDENNVLSGDIDFESCKDKASYITPVPGGVGPMTITMLLNNVIKATKLQLGIKN